MEVVEGNIRTVYRLARHSVASGGRPFGAIITVRDELRVGVADRVAQHRDPTAHPEMEAIRAFVRRFDPYELRDAILWTSVEPCPMCAGAIRYAGIAKLVYGVGRCSFDKVVAVQRGRPLNGYRGCREIIEDGGLTDVVGPVLEAVGIEVLAEYCFATRLRRLAG